MILMTIRAVLVGTLLGLTMACARGPAGARPTPAWTPPRQQSELSPTDLGLLRNGKAVHRERRLTRGDRRYLGTVSYQIVKARPATILALLTDVQALPELLPQTQRASLIEASPALRRVELVQGNDWFQAKYTVIMTADPEGGLRFSLDSTRPHDIDDVWGYFRAEPFDRDHTLITVGVAVDIGSGVFRYLFAYEVQRVILLTPDLVKRYSEQVEANRVASVD